MSVSGRQLNPFFSGTMVYGFILLFYVLFPLATSHAVTGIINEEERQWLITHDGKVKLAPAPDWEPMEFFDAQGEYKGMVADYIHLIEKKLNFKFKIVRSGTWENTLVLAKKREIDVISAAQPTPERKKFMNWTTPYLNLKTTIIVQRSLNKTFTLDQMQGMKIGVPRGYAVGKFIRANYPQLTMIDVATGSEGLHKVSFGELDAMIMEVPNALYVIENEKITNLRLAGDTGFELNQGIGVRSDWPILARIIEKALADISEKEHKAIYNKWIRLETIRFYQTRTFWYSMLGVTLIVLFITVSILIWNRTLKRQVMQRTEELRFNEMRLEALLDLNEQTHASIQEIIEFSFQQMIRLTKSSFGYLAFADQSGIIYSVDSSSENFLEQYITHNTANGFTIETMGLWGEAVRQKKGVISNNYTISNPDQKGLPPEYIKLSRYMNVPIFNEEKVVVVAGMGNKNTDYDQSDLRQLSLLALGMWRILQRKKNEQAIYNSEKSLSDLVENSPNGIVIMQQGKVVYRNSKQLELIGDIKPVDRIGYAHIYSEDVDKVRLFYKGIEKGNPTITELDFRFYSSLEKRTKETMKWVTCLVTPINYKEDKAFLLTTIDRTRARELEHLLTIQDKMASLGRVTAGIGHEIRNPLSGINIYLRTLEKSIENPDKAYKIPSAIKAIRTASGKMESVIKRVIDFAKPMEPRFSLMDINSPVLEAIQLANMSLDKKHISMEVNLDRTLPKCYAEHNLIEEVILNLINNSADAMINQADDRMIRVSSKLDGDKIALTVEDSGPGVPVDFSEKIFEPFFTTKKHSTGIGLSLCHRIITDHKGSLKVLQGDLGGATFKIELPCKPAVSEMKFKKSELRKTS